MRAVLRRHLWFRGPVPLHGREQRGRTAQWRHGQLGAFSVAAESQIALGKHGFLRVSTHPACARFKFGDARLSEKRFAAYIPAGIAGRKGALTALLQGANVPALRGQSDRAMGLRKPLGSS